MFTISELLQIGILIFLGVLIVITIVLELINGGDDNGEA